LLCAGCFSPKYHNGNLHCTASDQCPKDYHCAVDKTCWHNGSDPDAATQPGDAGVPDATVMPEAGAEGPDAIQPLADAPGTPDLATGVEDAIPEARAPSDTASPPDQPAGPEVSPAEVADLAVPDAPLADVALPADGPDASGAEAAGLGVPLDQLAAEYARVVCARDFACCTQADLRGKTLANCQQNVANLFQPAVQAVSDGVSRGRTIYYPERAQACLQTLEATSCQAWPLDPVTQLPAICASAIEPQVTAGGPCRSAADCVTGLCTGASTSADGTCLPKAASGQSCVQILGQNSCEPELYCDSTNKCAATKSDGTSCGGNRECQSLTCGAAPDAGNLCQPALCYSNGPLLPPACSVGGRPSAFAAGLVLASLALILRRRVRRRGGQGR
jgi:hypothetical protein